MTTLELALTMAFVCAVAGSFVWWQVAAFDREFGKMPRVRKQREGET